MRDIALFALVFGLIPYILRHPYIGVLTWSWLSYMNPHRLTWAAAYDFPFAQLVAITLFVSLLINREEKRFPPMNGLLFTWIAFLAWTMITTLNAYYPNAAWSYEIQVFKIQLIIFIILWMMGSEQRIRLMVWVIFFSVGFFGIKGGIFTITTGGGGRVMGPAGTFIGDNNHLAVALLMVLPLGFYLSRYEVQRRLYRNLFLLAGLLITASVIGSFSRGAFLAIIAVSLYLWWKTPGKIISGALGTLVLVTFILAMPQSWMDRMGTIDDYKQDGSAQGRINAWYYSINIANARLTGGGYLSWSGETFRKWAPNPNNIKVAHSIYFATLADHGWPGLILFLLIFIQSWFMAGKISRHVKKRGSPEDQWMKGLADMIKVSLVAYAVGGTFLSLAYFDLPWHMVAIIVLVDRLAREKGLYQTKPGDRGSAARKMQPPVYR